MHIKLIIFIAKIFKYTNKIFKNYLFKDFTKYLHEITIKEYEIFLNK